MNVTRLLSAALTLTVCVALLPLQGCASLAKSEASVSASADEGFFSKMPWSKKDDGKPEPYPNPVKMAATWAPDTLTQSGRVPTRGFGARVFFYDEKSRPVAVDGTLVVHAFDETAEDPKQAMKRYEFTPEQFTRHFSQTDLGASYSVWVPWDAVGGKQSRISLVATFQSRTGKTIQGIPSAVLLPGRKDDSAEALARRFSPEYREWQQAAAGNVPPSSGLTTTTITRPARQVTPGREPAATPAPNSTWNLAAQPSGRSVGIAMRSDKDQRVVDADPGARPHTPGLGESPTSVPVRPAAMRLPPP